MRHQQPRQRIASPPVPPLPTLFAQVTGTRALLDDPAAWIPDNGTRFAQDASGAPCSPSSSMAVAFTWRGAIALQCGSLEQRGRILDLVARHLRGATGYRGGSTALATYAEVLAALDAAAIEARERRLG